LKEWSDEVDALKTIAWGVKAPQNSHPNLVSFKGATIFESSKLAIVMGLIKGKTLAQAIQDSETIKTVTLSSICIDIANALRFMTECQLVHRDLAPKNIMLVRLKGVPKYRAVVIDLGMGRHVDYRTRFQGFFARDICAPETLKNNKVGSKNDNWAFGLVMYQILEKKVPFHQYPEDKRNTIVQKLLVSDNLVIMNELPLTLKEEPELIEIMKGCLEADEKKRWDWDTVLKALEKTRNTYKEEEDTEDIEESTTPINTPDGGYDGENLPKGDKVNTSPKREYLDTNT